jgi:hypothetical protein
MKINGIKLDMGHGMQQREPPGRAAKAAARHIAGVQKLWPRWSRGKIWRGRIADGQRLARCARRKPRSRMSTRQRGFRAPIGTAQHLDRHFGE